MLWLGLVVRPVEEGLAPRVDIHPTANTSQSLLQKCSLLLPFLATPNLTTALAIVSQSPSSLCCAPPQYGPFLGPIPGPSVWLLLALACLQASSILISLGFPLPQPCSQEFTYLAQPVTHATPAQPTASALHQCHLQGALSLKEYLSTFSKTIPKYLGPEEALH